MTTLQGLVRAWRRRVAYRLLGTREPRHDETPPAVPVRLDYAPADIWLRATSAPERRWRARSCAKEPWTGRWIEEFVGRGDVLYDIGANVGAFSLVAAIGRNATVVAFEPGYANFTRLCENILLNECAEAIVPVPLPLSDAPGLLPFRYRSLEPGQSRHALGEATEPPGQPASSPYVQPMCAVTLDRAVADFNLPAPHHVKIDVDGSELRVLRGGAEVLRGPQLRSVLIETDADVSEPLAAELSAAGFRLHARHDRPDKRDAPSYVLWVR
jgi:FkbM family methyltransferase